MLGTYSYMGIKKGGNEFDAPSDPIAGVLNFKHVFNEKSQPTRFEIEPGYTPKR